MDGDATVMCARCNEPQKVSTRMAVVLARLNQTNRPFTCSKCAVDTKGMFARKNG